MVEVGGRPLLWHIMKYYDHFGHRDFLVCVGHQAAVIESFVREVETAEGWQVDVVDTGLDASIGERFFAVRDRIGPDEVFLANYGDTVTDVPLPTLIHFRKRSGRCASLLAVRPNYTFNVVTAIEGGVIGFHDIGDSGLWINGGYFVMSGEVFDYIEPGEDLPAMFRRLIEANELAAYEYGGFWAPMDTMKDKERLEALVASRGSVWQVWDPGYAPSS